MLIHDHMDIDDLKVRMSNTESVSDEGAEAMRWLLVKEFEGIDTSDVPAADWHRMLTNL